MLQEQAAPANDEGQRDESDLIVFNLREITKFREEGPYVQVLSDTGAARVVLFTFKVGQELREHTTSSQIIVQALRGRITFMAEGKKAQLQAGMVLQLEANVPHSVIARTNAIMLLTMTPSPSFHSLEREVFKDLKPLVTRMEETVNQP